MKFSDLITKVKEKIGGTRNRRRISRSKNMEANARMGIKGRLKERKKGYGRKRELENYLLFVAP